MDRIEENYKKIQKRLSCEKNSSSQMMVDLNEANQNLANLTDTNEDTDVAADDGKIGGREMYKNIVTSIVNKGRLNLRGFCF
ncbi:MAG: hypothetical protein WC089_03420 [Candidatus Paceibacterota bacterium]